MMEKSLIKTSDHPALKHLEKWTTCLHKDNNEIGSGCIHCDIAWCIERIKHLESQIVHKCECCKREVYGKGPVSYPVAIVGVKIFMCQTCWAIWYDGQTDIEKIRIYSLKWPVDYIGAYATDNEDRIKETIAILKK